MQFDLPRPPSVNAMFRNVPGVGRVKTGDYVAWKKEAMREMMVQRVGQEIPKAPVQITVCLPDAKGRWDADNYVKAPLDCLKAMGVIEDDNKTIVRRLLIEIGEQKERCFIIVESLKQTIPHYGKVS